MSAAAWMITGLALLAGGSVGLGALWLARSGGRDRVDEHAATAALDPATSPEHLARTAQAALTPDALPDAVPVIPGPVADPGPVIAAAVDHLASAIAAQRLGCDPGIATQWQARAHRALHRLTADQLTDQLLTALVVVAAERADELLHPTPTTPQES